MSLIAEPQRLQPPAAASAGPSPPAAVEFRYVQSESFVSLLEQLGATLLVSTYQANKLLVVRAAGGGLSTLVRTFQRPMGIAADARRLALGTRDQIWLLRNAPEEPPIRHELPESPGAQEPVQRSHESEESRTAAHPDKTRLRLDRNLPASPPGPGS
jgi:hypothetical protein